MPPATRTISDQEGAIVIDERHAPVYIAAWFGAASEATARAYFAWTTEIIEGALRSRRACAIVVDSEDAGRPSAKVRALMAELSDQVPRAEDLLRVYVALPNPLVRGALTAMQWLSRKPWPMVVVPSIGDGITKSIEWIRANGGGVPSSLVAQTHKRLSRTG